MYFRGIEKALNSLDDGADRGAERIVVGWSPNGDETQFVMSPTKFCQTHRLSACQAGIVRFLSRYQFEKNSWLIDQSSLLAQLLIEFGTSQRPSVLSCLRTKLGFQHYVAPRIRSVFGRGLSVSNYCLVNGLSPQIALLIGLVCNAPTTANLKRAEQLMIELKAKR